MINLPPLPERLQNELFEASKVDYETSFESTFNASNNSLHQSNQTLNCDILFYNCIVDLMSRSMSCRYEWRLARCETLLAAYILAF